MHWSGRYLNINLQADDTSFVTEKFKGDDSKDVETGLVGFDSRPAEFLPFIITQALAERFTKMKADLVYIQQHKILDSIWGYKAGRLHEDIEMTKTLRK